MLPRAAGGLGAGLALGLALLSGAAAQQTDVTVECGAQGEETRTLQDAPQRIDSVTAHWRCWLPPTPEGRALAVRVRTWRIDGRPAGAPELDVVVLPPAPPPSGGGL